MADLISSWYMLDPAGRHVLLIEDLIDTGHTLKWVQRHLQSKDCARYAIPSLVIIIVSIMLTPSFMGADAGADDGDHHHSVKIACLLDKKARRTVDVDIDFVGYECPDEYVIR